jgi:hypothetical protein
MTIAVTSVPQGTPSEVTHQEQDNARHNINHQGKEARCVVHRHHGRTPRLSVTGCECASGNRSLGLEHVPLPVV